VSVELEKAHRKFERTKHMMVVARETLLLQQERLRLVSDQLKARSTNLA